MATTKAPRKNKKIKRPDLKIGIKDFGSIAEGEIELKPLTVFIGPNNSGKSYAAMLLYSVLESFNLTSIGEFSVARSISYIEKNDILKTILYESIAKIRNLKSDDAWQIPNEVWQKIAFEEIKEICENRLSKMIERSLACQLIDLVLFKKEIFTLNIKFDSYNINMIYNKWKLAMQNFIQPNMDMDYKVKISEGSDIHDFPMDAEKGKIFTFMDKEKWSGSAFPNSESEEISSLRDLLAMDFEGIIYNIMKSFILKCHYLPSARSDKLQFYKLIAGNIFRQATSFGVEKQQAIPKLLGVVSDFISSIIEISPEVKGHFYQFAEELEKELLKGSIVFESSDANLLPEIKYRFQGVDIPLQRASSSVSEIAPLILYLKYIVEPGSVLIIEEPEAHLHPENQRILAKYLVRLINQGVNVLITTHSEYMLEQLNNFILLSNIDSDEIIERYGYEEGDYISYKDIAVYEFQYDKETGTSKIKKAGLTKKDGVSQEEFTKILESLYRETSKLRRDLRDE
jgi:predicted ATPase